MPASVFTTMFHIFMILVGSFLQALAFEFLILPNQILSSGLTGITIIIDYFTGAGVSLLILVLNVPVFLWGYRKLGTRFVLYSAVTVVSLSAMLKLIQPFGEHVTSDALLASIFGGVLIGIGTALWLQVGSSGGGVDIVGILLNRRYGYSIGQVLMMINALIILCSVFLFDLEQAMYTLISIFVVSKVIDALQAVQHRRTVMIISAKTPEITERIWEDLYRGVTYIDGSGAYSHTPTKIILCVMTRFEIVECKNIVLDADPNAFITVNTTDEVVGSFRPKKYKRPKAQDNVTRLTS